MNKIIGRVSIFGLLITTVVTISTAPSAIAADQVAAAAFSAPTSIDFAKIEAVIKITDLMITQAEKTLAQFKKDHTAELDPLYSNIQAVQVAVIDAQKMFGHWLSSKEMTSYEITEGAIAAAETVANAAIFMIDARHFFRLNNPEFKEFVRYEEIARNREQQAEAMIKKARQIFEIARRQFELALAAKKQ